ncbi:Ferredoxin subunit of nitrite reductase or a ring-hydroxylating dioxygenase [Pseudomonas taetrolens]|uniref:Ferredoxin subunit of nitrite reductase or a ring-hydroxylating dioxygenase n=1 Tax=Pseudomonas taetrolens TaxID=47884 RepID=A0A0J6JGA5_PSETA|nr:Rieske (2Fe-2S) protein [Pseudomonas taetrolens]KMM82787.1 Rieske (2Fe-2S) protein [Pseudomonas taetrolens]SED15316.1 Ferredoxin subunit of nitrite reductase or a ring-hydroxylating dioxygenase [Pseudomonas taetrolens]SQF87968.1 putative ferredoxin [Pseudomonas taetrolens]VEH51158.1 putative ferredoxin [Pseudomonas taetrolens]
MKFLCPSEALAEGSSRGFEYAGLRVLAVRREGRVYAYQNRCPHRGVPLEWQPDQFLDASASLIQCATHGALFLIETGECVAGPCAGQSLTALGCREDSQGVWFMPEISDDDL